MTQPKKSNLTNDPWAKLVSPLPWNDEGDEVFIYDADGVPVATTDKAWLPYDVRIANNRFIILACNVHDELLAALKTAETVLSNIAAPFVLKNGEHAIGEARLREIRVALADTTAIIAKCDGR